MCIKYSLTVQWVHLRILYFQYPGDWFWAPQNHPLYFYLIYKPTIYPHPFSLSRSIPPSRQSTELDLFGGRPVDNKGVVAGERS